MDITELCPSATVLAQQLTHVELERLSYIGPEEFVQAFAKVSLFLNGIALFYKYFYNNFITALANYIKRRYFPLFRQESPHLETSFKDMKKTRNLESYVQWFNRLSYFVATEVCKVSIVILLRINILSDHNSCRLIKSL